MLWLPLQLFAGCLAFFHISEFALACAYMRQELSLTSLLISRPYAVAIACAIAEYTIESVWLPRLNPQALLCVGLAMAAAGELLRKSAMLTAKRSFTHRLCEAEHPTNELVCHGPYSCMRHPGYAGWMLWSVGTQVMLCNPACIIGFAIASWCFFKRRIAVEECQLRRCFWPRYEAYAARVPSGIPGIP